MALGPKTKELALSVLKKRFQTAAQQHNPQTKKNIDFPKSFNVFLVWGWCCWAALWNRFFYPPS